MGEPSLRSRGFIRSDRNICLHSRFVNIQNIFENGGRTDGRRTDAGSMGIL